MSDRCHEIQALLVDEGVGVLDSRPELREHIVECTPCAAFLDASEEIESCWDRLEHPTPPAFELPAGVGSADSGPSEPAPQIPPPANADADSGVRRVRWFPLIGTLAAVALAGFTFVTLFVGSEGDDNTSADSYEDGGRSTETLSQAGHAEEDEEPPEDRRSERYRGEEGRSGGGDDFARPDGTAGLGGATSREVLAPEEPADPMAVPATPPMDGNFQAGLFGNEGQGQHDEPTFDNIINGEAYGRRSAQGVVGGGRYDDDNGSDTTLALEGSFEELDLDGDTVGATDNVVLEETAESSGATGGIVLPTNRRTLSLSTESYLDRISSLEGLTYANAHGYWANTYLPGDPGLRALHGRLVAAGSGALDLAHRSTMYTQPFDEPENSAIAVYMHADQPTANEETRLTLQVGIQAASRLSGQRPTMNVALVIDLRTDLDDDDEETVRELVHALRLEYDLGDAFSLYVAGRHGGLYIEPGDFGYGEVTVALDRIFDGADSDRTYAELDDVVHDAMVSVATSDDPTAPLGSSLVVIATPGFDQAEDSIELLAHEGAVEGITTSVIGVGNASGSHHMDRIAYAGHGRRHEVAAVDEAADMMHAEILANGTVVARAVRLRIRLAEGVELVDVLGSYNLDEVEAQRVRDAEESIDRRLASSLGIEADRGEDEDGIQIVIPAFHAGDTHVILLDVVVSGAGPVADVTARFKDLIHLNNGVVRDTFAVQRGHEELGPLELNVVKNRLAYEIAERLEVAANQLEYGNSGRAISELETIRALITELPLVYPGLVHDPDLAGDVELVDHYLNAIREGRTSYSELAGSMRYASYLKHNTPMEEEP